MAFPPQLHADRSLCSTCSLHRDPVYPGGAADGRRVHVRRRPQPVPPVQRGRRLPLPTPAHRDVRAVLQPRAAVLCEALFPRARLQPDSQDLRARQQALQGISVRRIVLGVAFFILQIWVAQQKHSNTRRNTSEYHLLIIFADILQ